MSKQMSIFEFYGIKIGNEEDEQPGSQPTNKQGTDETGEQPSSGDKQPVSQTGSEPAEETEGQSGSEPTNNNDETETDEEEYRDGDLKGNYQEISSKLNAQQQAKSQSNSSTSPTIVISAFVCSGKSTFAANCEYVKDLESSIYSKKPDGTRSDEFPGNYISAIKWQLNNNNWKYLLVSSHQDVRKAMKEAGIKFYLFYPALERKEEIIKLCQERGNDAEFIQLMQENYEAWVTEMSKEENSYPLQEGEFLSLELFEKKYKFLYQ